MRQIQTSDQPKAAARGQGSVLRAEAGLEGVRRRLGASLLRLCNSFGKSKLKISKCGRREWHRMESWIGAMAKSLLGHP